MTKLEQTLAEALAKATNVDIPAIIAAAEACCLGGQTVQETKVSVVETAAAEQEKPKRTRKTAEAAPAPAEEKPATPPLAEEKEEPATTNATSPQGIDISGLFTGSGADKKVVKDVFLAAVEKAKNLAALVALNATCDCGFATGDYTEETAAVLKRKLSRWGAAQE